MSCPTEASVRWMVNECIRALRRDDMDTYLRISAKHENYLHGLRQHCRHEQVRSFRRAGLTGGKTTICTKCADKLTPEIPKPEPEEAPTIPKIVSDKTTKKGMEPMAEMVCLAKELRDEWQCTSSIRIWTNEEKHSFISRSADLADMVAELLGD